MRKGPEATDEISETDREFLRQAFALLPEEPWNGSTWKIWTDNVRKETGRKGKSLFMPLRLALTGLSSGPERRSFCLCWVGKERWPDDPDPALAGRRQLRGLRLRQFAHLADVETAFGVGQRLRIGSDVRAAPRDAGSPGKRGPLPPQPSRRRL